MTSEDVFSKISSHMIKGIMIHEELANYFGFLKLCNYEREQTKRYVSESKSLAKLHSYYTGHYCKLFPKTSIEIPSVIPEAYFGHESSELDAKDIRSSVKSIFERWVEWEEETKALYVECYIELRDNISDVTAAIMVMDLIKDVDEELMKAKNHWYVLKNSNYDIVLIMEENANGQL